VATVPYKGFDIKALIILAILATLALVVYTYKKDKNLKKLLISLATFTVIISLAVMGNLTRPIMPIFLAHVLLLIVAWGAGLKYVWSGKYYWWVIFSPFLTIGLFLLLEFTGGSGHELT
jgi:hypothetical protein